MPFSQSEMISKLDKLILQIYGTSDAAPGSKYWYNESERWVPIIDPTKVWNDVNSILPANTPAEADANVASQPTLLEKRTIHLTEDITTNHRTYVARSIFGDATSDIVENWILPALVRNNGGASNGYIVKLFNGDPSGAGVELSTTYHGGSAGEPSWIFSYSNGILTISDDEASHFNTLDLWIVGYRYIGETGGTSSGGGGFDMTFVQADLTAGILSVPHNLDAINSVIHISIRDENNNKIFADNVNFIDSNNLEVDLTAFTDILGTWALTVGIGGGSGGSSDHATLTNLTYDSSNHIGFHKRHIGTTAPTSGNDSSDTAGIGIIFTETDFWKHNSDLYQCKDATSGAAVWEIVGGGTVDPLQVNGDTKTTLNGSFDWTNEHLTLLPIGNNIKVGDIVSMSYSVPSLLWINTELSNNAGDDFILIPIAGNTIDFIVTGQQFVVTGGIADGNTYEIGSDIYLNGTIISGYHIADINYISGTIITLPTYPTVDIPTSIDRVGGAQTITKDSRVVTIVSGTEVDIATTSTTSTTITTIDIYSHHYIQKGNLALGKEVGEYLLDIEGTGKIPNLITNQIITEYPKNSNDNFSPGDLVFFGNNLNGDIELSNSYTKYFNEGNTGFTDFGISTDTIEQSIALFGSDDIGVSLIWDHTGGHLTNLLPFKMSSSGNIMGTQTNVIPSGLTGHSTRIYNLEYAIGDSDINDATKVVGVTDYRSVSTGDIWTGYFIINNDLTVSILKSMTNVVSGLIGGTLVDVIPLKIKTSSTFTTVDMRYSLHVYEIAGISYLQIISFDVNTSTELAGNLYPLQAGSLLSYPENRMFAHLRESLSMLHVFKNASNGSGIQHVSLNYDAVTNNILSINSVEVFGNINSKIMYAEFYDTYIGMDSFEYKILTKDFNSVFSIIECIWEGTSSSTTTYSIKENGAYSHGVDYYWASKMGTTNKVMLYGQNTDRNLLIIDLKDKTHSSIHAFSNIRFMSRVEAQNNTIALKDSYIHTDTWDGYDFVKFYHNKYGLYHNEYNGVATVVMQGVYTYSSDRFRLNNKYYLGPVSHASGSTSIGITTEVSSGQKLGDALSKNVFYFNPQIISIQSSPTNIGMTSITTTTTTVQSIPASATTIIEYDSKSHDDLEEFDVTTYTFTTRTAGYYQFEAGAKLSSTDATICNLGLYTGGTPAVMFDESYNASGSPENKFLKGSVTRICIANEAFTVRIYQGGTGTINLSNDNLYTYFRITRIK